MKLKVARVAIAVAAFALWSHSQPYLGSASAHEPAANFDWLSQLLGTWESEDRRDGQPRITIDLRLEEGKPAGSVVIRGVRGDYDPNSLTLEIRDVALQTGALSFETDPGEDGITHWTLSMVSGEKSLLSAVRDEFEIPKYVMQRPEH
jgi:hypothetical protein